MSAAAADGETSTDAIKLTAGGRDTDVVHDGTMVRVIATERGTVPDGERPALLEILGGYEYKGQTQAHALRKCTTTRCEIDPTLRMPSTWTYQAFYFGKSGTVLAQSRIVKVEWIKQEP